MSVAVVAETAETEEAATDGEAARGTDAGRHPLTAQDGAAGVIQERTSAVRADVSGASKEAILRRTARREAAALVEIPGIVTMATEEETTELVGDTVAAGTALHAAISQEVARHRESVEVLNAIIRIAHLLERTTLLVKEVHPVVTTATTVEAPHTTTCERQAKLRRIVGN